MIRIYIYIYVERPSVLMYCDRYGIHHRKSRIIRIYWPCSREMFPGGRFWRSHLRGRGFRRRASEDDLQNALLCCRWPMAEDYLTMRTQRISSENGNIIRRFGAREEGYHLCVIKYYIVTLFRINVDHFQQPKPCSIVAFASYYYRRNWEET